MDWCDCGSLHHAMAHAVFSLASRPPSSCGTPEVPLTPTPTVETAHSASRTDAESRACAQHAAPSTEMPADTSYLDDSVGAGAHTGAVTARGGTTTAGSSSDGGSGSAEAGMSGTAGSSSGESNSGSSNNSMRGMRTRYRGLLRTARDIAQGLEHLHCCGIVHGALEPSNVLLKGSPTDARGFVARLSNFNTSLASATAAPSEFTAPEIREGKVASIHPTADIWSFGTLLKVMVIRSLEAAHPGHDFGYTFSDSEAKPSSSRSPRHSSTTSTNTMATGSSMCSRQQEGGAAPAALIPQELTDLYHRCTWRGLCVKFHLILLRLC
ncbi:hypothetical protein DUNSADRAFT_18144 [Dunaliella salina]|uniref:Protein kinase domain-containing protein n=1 Tax=Dunaliella salina TaxID=3046 RepID=A0ABQ7GZG4_DUNSA|nr:hypothetical protein DUNSADRAFT_18144 [Dunaliella salina]|eukprot:KAF5839984.1 hypothetical protein DUNSADRAFT_18144 [Dunaliella salina]